MLENTKKHIFLIGCIFFASSTAFDVNAYEEDPAKTCKSAAELFKEGDVDGALEEARWCVTQLEQMKQGQISEYFKDEVNGYKGGKIASQQAMGMSSVERSYTKKGSKIKVSLAGGASSAGNSAFSALAQFGLQMGGSGTKVRIQRRSAVINNKGNSVQLIVTLKSGGMLNFDSRDVDEDELVAFAKKFPVKELDEARN